MATPAPPPVDSSARPQARDPKRCASCDQVEDDLCAHSISISTPSSAGHRRASGPLCKRCMVHYATKVGDGRLCTDCQARPAEPPRDAPLPDMHRLIAFERMLVQALNASYPRARLGSIVKGMVMLKRRAGEARQKVAGQSRRRIPLTYADTQRHVPLGWPCPRCTYLNVAARQACELCAQPRPANPEPEALAVSQQQELLQGIKLLEQRAAHLDVQQMVMKDDGNCQFRAVAYQLYRDQGYHPQVRRRAVAEIKAQKATYINYFEGEGDFKLYIKKMGQDGTWGDEVTLRAIADTFGVTIHILSSTAENWRIQYEPMGELQTGRHAFISYISPVHYNSLTHIAEDGDYIKTYSPEKYACLIRASQLYENSPTAQFTKDHLKLEFDALDGNKDGSLSGQEIQQLYHQLRCYGVLSQTVIDETISHWDMLDDGKVTFQEFAVLLNPFLHLDSPGGPGSRKQSASAAPRRQSVTLSNPACRRQSAANTSASGRQSASPTLVT